MAETCDSMADSINELAAFEAHLQALETLHLYEGMVLERESMPDRGDTPYARFREDKIKFFDGAVRTATYADPKASWFGKEGISRFPIIAGDALMTGPDGINAHSIDTLAQLEYPVVWLHHQGRHMESPTDLAKAVQFARFVFKKSVGRSAHHQHLLLDWLNGKVDFDTDNVVSIGDSRQAMTGEATDALAPLYDRNIIWSDYIADCFEHAPNLRELPALAISPLREGSALRRLGKRITTAAHLTGDEHELRTYAGTFDIHPKNIINELAWLVPLIRGDAGHYADAVPLDAHGARTHLDGDSWSSGGHDWEAKYDIRPNIYFSRLGLPDGNKARHLDLADPEVQGQRFARLERLLAELRNKNYISEAVDYDYVALGLHAVKQAA